MSKPNGVFWGQLRGCLAGGAGKWLFRDFPVVHKGHHLLQTRPSELEGFPKDTTSPRDAFTGIKVEQTSWRDFRGLEINEPTVLFAILPLAAGAEGMKRERVCGFGSAFVGNWLAFCLISIPCSKKILDWLLSTASARLGAELWFLRSWRDYQLGFQPLLLT